MEQDKGMTDCHYYFTATCTRGESCAFRHCEAAKKTTQLCKWWNQGKCNKLNCKFRHPSTLKKPQKSTRCTYFFSPTGCNRGDSCMFSHVDDRAKQLEKELQSITQRKTQEPVASTQPSVVTTTPPTTNSIAVKVSQDFPTIKVRMGVDSSSDKRPQGAGRVASAKDGSVTVRLQNSSALTSSPPLKRDKDHTRTTVANGRSKSNRCTVSAGENIKSEATPAKKSFGVQPLSVLLDAKAPPYAEAPAKRKPDDKDAQTSHKKRKTEQEDPKQDEYVEEDDDDIDIGGEEEGGYDVDDDEDEIDILG